MEIPIVPEESIHLKTIVSYKAVRKVAEGLQYGEAFVWPDAPDRADATVRRWKNPNGVLRCRLGVDRKKYVTVVPFGSKPMVSRKRTPLHIIRVEDVAG